MNPHLIERLPILIINPYSRCNCRCAMCDIWKTTDVKALSAGIVQKVANDLKALRTEWVVFSGGEALMHPELFRFCEILRSACNLRLSLLTSGLLLEQHAEDVARWFDDVIVSLDGPPATHDHIRGVTGAFRVLLRGVEALRRRKGDFAISARSTVQNHNAALLRRTVETARELKLNGISFLAVDLDSQAFNHNGLTQIRRNAVAVAPERIPLLEDEIEALIAGGECGGFVAESAEKLQRIAAHCRAAAGLGSFEAPVCNAPWVSAVLEADGRVRPCFFHNAYDADVSRRNLADVINETDAVSFRSGLAVARNDVCRRCVCSLNLKRAAY